MENWIIFAILSPFFFVLSNIIDKFVLEKKIKNIYTYGVIVGLCGLVSGILVFLFTLQPFGLISSFWAILTGLIYGFSYLIYFKAVSTSDISTAVTLLFIYPIFTALFAFIFLQEKLALVKYIAIILLISGAVLMSLEKSKDKRGIKDRYRIKVVLWLMLAVAVIMGIFNTVAKFTLESLSYWNVYFLTWVGAAIVLMFPLIFKKNKIALKDSFKFIHLIVYQQILAFIGLLMFFIATSLTKVSIVAALDVLRSPMAFIFMILISLFRPQLLKESINKETILRKVFAIILIVAGIILIFK